MTSWWEAPVDLLLGGRCVGCARGGSAVCGSCLADLPGSSRLAWPDPTPPGLCAPYTLSEYAGVVRAMILGHKERGLLSLGRPLGQALAIAIGTAVVQQTGASAPASVPLVLVPVPSRRASVRSRGHDPMLSITRHAATSLIDAGWSACCTPLLRPGRGLADQSGLDAEQRTQNVRGSMRVADRPRRRAAARLPEARRIHTVVCDDVLTTGATAREAQRALEAAGIDVTAVATIAATRRRAPLRGGI